MERKFMEKGKKKRLIKAGWKFGDAEDFLKKPEKLREKIYDIVYSGLDCPVLYDRLIKTLEEHGVYLDTTL
jgi:hypothetical protein